MTATPTEGGSNHPHHDAIDRAYRSKYARYGGTYVDGDGEPGCYRG
ncbi:hypothetical protein HC028_10735 [Planosporangium flavigriseum]|nr:hypothetical protein [Planosporangium flavigriseum]NJC64975.1 hypothetical protein [Planosporangium flavigriseum]